MNKKVHKKKLKLLFLIISIVCFYNILLRFCYCWELFFYIYLFLVENHNIFYHNDR